MQKMSRGALLATLYLAVFEPRPVPAAHAVGTAPTAGTAGAERCGATEQRQFDFWVGEWSGVERQPQEPQPVTRIEVDAAATRNRPELFELARETVGAMPEWDDTRVVEALREDLVFVAREHERLVGYLARDMEDALRVYCACPLEVRAGRFLQREPGFTEEQALARVEERDEADTRSRRRPRERSGPLPGERRKY